MHLDPTLARFPPSLLYWVFVPCDIISLVLQAAGGGTSTTAAVATNSAAASNSGLGMSLAGLLMQVITLAAFAILAGDYLVRYARAPDSPYMSRRVKVFLVCMWLAIVFILVRCAYRIAELHGGYTGPLFHEEGKFYVLEST